MKFVLAFRSPRGSSSSSEAMYHIHNSIAALNSLHHNPTNNNNNNNIEDSKHHLKLNSISSRSGSSSGAKAAMATLLNNHSSSSTSSKSGSSNGADSGPPNPQYVGGTLIKQQPPDLDDSGSDSPSPIAGPSVRGSGSRSGGVRGGPRSGSGAGSSSLGSGGVNPDAALVSPNPEGGDASSSFLHSDETAQYEADKRLIYKWVHQTTTNRDETIGTNVNAYKIFLVYHNQVRLTGLEYLLALAALLETQHLGNLATFWYTLKKALCALICGLLIDVMVQKTFARFWMALVRVWYGQGCKCVGFLH